MSDFPTKSEMELMVKYKIRKVFDENKGSYVYKWQERCATRRCKAHWCKCSDSLENAINVISGTDRKLIRCTIHDPDIIAELKAEWISARESEPWLKWKQYLEDSIDAMDWETDFGDGSRLCECDIDG